MADVRGDVLWPPHCTTPAAVKAKKKKKKKKKRKKERKKKVPSLW